VSHCEPDAMALVALGEVDGLDAERAHLETCAECAAEVAAFSEIVTTARQVTEADTPVAPPASVWQAIQHELGTGGTTDELAERRSRRSTAPWIAVAAAAGLLLGGLGTAAYLNVPTQQTADVVAQAQLEPLPGNAVSGMARVEQRAEGPYLTVDVSTLPQSDGYYEVWLLKPDVSSMVSIGVLPEAGSASFPLPNTLDLNEFSVVDVSREAYDGDATHSTDSVVRGSLPA